VLSVHPCWLPFVPHCQSRAQHGSNCRSITGPISVASSCFPLSNVLIDFAKLFRLRRFEDWVGEVASSNLVVPTIPLQRSHENLGHSADETLHFVSHWTDLLATSTICEGLPFI
jgi:hypothetical protein